MLGIKRFKPLQFVQQGTRDALWLKKPGPSMHDAVTHAGDLLEATMLFEPVDEDHSSRPVVGSFNGRAFGIFSRLLKDKA